MPSPPSPDPVALGLPHRPPFIFVDRVTRLDPGASAEATLSLPADTPFFAGHFPGNPLVPGVILTEALAQTAGLAAATPEAPRSFFLSAIRQMKFLRHVRPGDPILLEASKLGEFGGILQFAVRASVNGAPAAEGTIVLSQA